MIEANIVVSTRNSNVFRSNLIRIYIDTVSTTVFHCLTLTSDLNCEAAMAEYVWNLYVWQLLNAFDLPFLSYHTVSYSPVIKSGILLSKLTVQISQTGIRLRVEPIEDIMSSIAYLFQYL